MHEQEIAVRKCIDAEIEALLYVRDNLIDSVIAVAKTIGERNGDIIVTGVGKSGYIGMKLVATLTSLGQYASFLHPTEALHGDLGMVREGDMVIALSNSGNTEEIVKLVKIIKRMPGVMIVGITGNRESFLAEESGQSIVYSLSEEGCPIGVAPMASTTVTLAIGDMLATSLARETSFTKESFAVFHPGGSLGLSLMKVGERMRDIRGVTNVLENTEVPEIVSKINETNLGIAAVIDSSGRLLGSISDGDIRRAIIAYPLLHERTAKEIMREAPRTIDLHENLRNALRQMEAHKITSLFVVDDVGVLLGLIHMHDILDDTEL